MRDERAETSTHSRALHQQNLRTGYYPPVTFIQSGYLCMYARTHTHILFNCLTHCPLSGLPHSLTHFDQPANNPIEVNLLSATALLIPLTHRGGREGENVRVRAGGCVCLCGLK